VCVCALMSVSVGVSVYVNICLRMRWDCCLVFCLYIEDEGI